jgi:phi LC3 family holin
MINWKVRIKSKMFWVALIPAVLLLVQTVAAVFGYTLDFEALQGHLLEVVNAVFLVLTILGIVTDPTTAGFGDSALAMTYATPRVSDEATDLAMQQAIIDTCTFEDAA